MCATLLPCCFVVPVLISLFPRRLDRPIRPMAQPAASYGLPRLISPHQPVYMPPQVVHESDMHIFAPAPDMRILGPAPDVRRVRPPATTRTSASPPASRQPPPARQPRAAPPSVPAPPTSAPPPPSAPVQRQRVVRDPSGLVRVVGAPGVARATGARHVHDQLLQLLMRGAVRYVNLLCCGIRL